MLTVQDFHEKLHDGFFAVVVDVYAACLPQFQPNAAARCKLHRSCHAGDGSPSGATGTSPTRPTLRGCKTSQATRSRRSCWAAPRATSCSTATPAFAPSRPPTSSPRSASRAASTTAWASNSGRPACAHACTCSRHGQCPRLTVAALTTAGRRLPDRAHTVPRRPRLRASPRGLQLAAGAGAELPAQRARRRAAGEPCS